jgi:hypothetical protein
MHSSASLRYIYEKYYTYYAGKAGRAFLLDMIKAAKTIGENACSLFEEHASEFLDPSVTGDLLECLFEQGIIEAEEGERDSPSIRSLVQGHLKEASVEYRHILKFRSALTRDCLHTPMVSVQYFLVWKPL